MEPGYKLYYEDSREALRRCIEDGQGYKKTAAALWQAMTPESAYARIKACTKPDGDQKLEYDEVLFVMVFNRRFDPIMHACDQCHHDRPARRAPEDRQAALVETFNQRVEDLMSLVTEIRQGGSPMLKVAK